MIVIIIKMRLHPLLIPKLNIFKNYPKIIMDFDHSLFGNLLDILLHI